MIFKRLTAAQLPGHSSLPHVMAVSDVTCGHFPHVMAFWDVTCGRFPHVVAVSGVTCGRFPHVVAVLSVTCGRFPHVMAVLSVTCGHFLHVAGVSFGWGAGSGPKRGPLPTKKPQNACSGPVFGPLLTRGEGLPRGGKRWIILRPWVEGCACFRQKYRFPSTVGRRKRGCEEDVRG